MGRSRDIADFLGKTEANNTTNSLLTSVADGAGVTVYATVDNLPLSGNSAGDLAFVDDTDRFYIFTGAGWYSVSLVNATPVISSVLNSDGGSTPFTLSTEGASTVITITATDSDGIPLTFAANSDSGFSGLASLSQSDNVFTVTPFSEDSATTTSGTITFTASDGIQVATSDAQTFTLEFINAVQNSAETVLLAKASGNAIAYTTFTDNSTSSHTIIRNGNTPISSSFSPYRSGGYSFRNMGGGMQTDGSDDFGTGDFTVEAWINIEKDTNGNQAIVETRSTSSDTGFLFLVRGSGTGGTTRSLNVYTSGAYRLESDDIVPLNSWTHVVLTREGGTIKFFINGKSSGTASYSTTITSPGNYLVAGDIAGDGMEGYIKDFRIVTGTAVYTSEFSPPTASLTAITNTSLLTCHLPYLADGSINDHTITQNGNYLQHSIVPFSPYDYEPYSASDYGGSAFFDTVRYDEDQLRISSSTMQDLSSGSYTIEGWYFFQDGYNGILWTYQTGSADGYAELRTVPNILRLQKKGGTAIDASFRFKSHSWYHIATVWDGTNIKVYVNGKQVITSTTNVIDNSGNGFTIGGNEQNNYNEFHVSDFRIVNGTAVYTSNFTPPTAPLTALANTVLLTCQGTDAVLFDAAQIHNFKPSGNPSASTVQTKNASSSIEFDGYDYLEVTTEAVPTSDKDLVTDLRTDDFTIEFWLYNTNSSGTQNIFDMRNGSTGFVVNLIGGQIGVYSEISSGYALQAGALSTNTWYHISIVRNASNMTLFIDGVSTDTGTNSDDFKTSSGTSAVAVIGARYSKDQQYYLGYIEDLRITKGLARYPFIPVKETLAADTNTVLLTCHDSSVATAASGTGATTSNLSTTGDPTATTGPRYNLHAVDFDGNDNLVIPNGNTDLGAIDGAFTIEGWVNFDAAPPGTGNGNERQIVGQSSWPESSGGDWWNMYAVSTGIYWYAAGGGGYLLTQFQTFTWETGKWYHFALTRDASDEMGLFINGSYLAPTSNATNGKGILAADVRPLSIGADNDASHNGIDGKISNLRISNIVRYTKTFTPPTDELTG